MSSYLKAMQLTKQLEELAKAEKAICEKAENRRDIAKTIFELFEFNGKTNTVSADYLMAAEEFLKQKQYIDALVHSNLAILHDHNPEKSEKIEKIYQRIKDDGFIENNRFKDKNLGYIFLGKMDRYIEEAVGSSVKKTKHKLAEYEDVQKEKLLEDLKKL